MCFIAFFTCCFSTLLKAMLAGVEQKTLRQSFAAGALVALKERTGRDVSDC